MILRPATERITDRTLNLLWAAAYGRTPTQQHETTLRSLLRRFPFWRRGHKLLAESALARDNVGQAYAAALCYRMLTANNPTLSADALLVLATCFLRRGDWQTALDHLNKARLLKPGDHKIKEETAAAYMLAGNYPEALQLLSSIPETHITAEGKAALQFARSKTG